MTSYYLSSAIHEAHRALALNPNSLFILDGLAWILTLSGDWENGPSLTEKAIIKKVGNKMLEDPELGPDFIRPVKSQGVRSVGDSVMVIRVKFTAQPGKHFLIRREVFRRISEALAAQGIYYAHRKVIVEMPETEYQESTTDSDQTESTEVLAGAAAGLDNIVRRQNQPTTQHKEENF